MKIAVLTSSRADYSIYKPLLDHIKKEKKWELGIIAFGSHTSKKYGETINIIKNDGFSIHYKIDTLPLNDSPSAITEAMGLTIQKFSTVWKNSSYDLVFALGDRYEMFAAVAASLPFNIKVAHLHGGETTLGAIDNAFRHSISHISKIHFVSSEPYKKRLTEILGTKQGIYNVGALSIDNLTNLKLYTKKEFLSRFKINLKKPTILITFHPETVSYQKNERFIDILLDTLNDIKGYQYLITMPNADTMGLSIRKKIISFAKGADHIFLIESLGTIGYLSAIKHCSLMLGNTSSGFIEASFFPRWVINLGDRQKGRILTPNILQVDINKNQIIKALHKINKSDIAPLKKNIYGDGRAAQKIIKIINEKS